MNKVPLVVDLDGTLIKTDMLVESFLGLIKKRSLYTLMVPFWLLRGKVFLKKKLASLVDIDVTTLPYNEELLTYLRQEKKTNRFLVLATATNEKYATQIANHTKLFDEVISSDEKINLSGDAKANALVNKFGRGGFDYAGNEAVDLYIWSAAANAILVDTKPSTTKRAREVSRIQHQFTLPRNWWRSYLKQIRIHQWTKNLLIFVSLVVGHHFSESEDLLKCILGFICFSLIASSAYITNDLLDLPDDRKHKEKSTRPFAAGDIPVIQGLLLAPLLFIVSCLISLYFLPLNFLLIMLGYFCLTFFYSLYLKRFPIVDVVVLAFLYTVRIIAGAIVIDSDLSFWLLAFSVFIFLSLALIKRYSEIQAMDASDSINTVAGRGYLRSDLGLLSQFGIASGYISVLVFSLYINSEKVLQLYTNPEFLWCICMILLFWTSRIWLLAGRGLVNEDPILFAIKDKISAISGIIVASLIAISI